jgi:hypothetical protein
MWFPSECVVVKAPDVSLDEGIDGAAGRTRSVVQFHSVDEAARFIGARNGAKIGGSHPFEVRQPEDAN